MVMKSSFSSDTIPQTMFRFVRLLMKASLAKTSSFFCSSPCTFTLPTVPVMSTRPACRISWFTTFAASRIQFSSRLSSPEEYSKSFWLLMINSPRV